MGLTSIATPPTGQLSAWSATNPLGQKYWTNYYTYNAPTGTGRQSYAVSTRIQYLGGYYIFGDSNGNLCYSTDAKTWNQTQPNTTNGITGIAYNGTNFVVTYSNNTIYTASTPSGTWTARTSAQSGTGNINDIRWVSQLSLFIACGNGTTTPFNSIQSSPDGITWTNRYTAGSAMNFTIIAIDDTTATPTLVIGSDSATATSAVYSTNGTSWSTTNPNANSQSVTIQFIKGALSRFVVAYNGNYFYTQTSAAVATAWNTTPYVVFRSPANSAWFSNATQQTYSIGELQYDSVNNLYYMATSYINGSGIVNPPTLFTLDASKLVTAQLTTGTYTYYDYPIIKTEFLPPISFGTNSNYPSAGYGYANNIHIWVTTDQANYRQIYTTA